MAKHSWMVEEWEETKVKDPVHYRYHYDNPFKTNVDFGTAKEKLDVVMDHIFLLAWPGGCHLGTSYILDYVLPDANKGETYPTKWFMVSNAHVLSSVNFNKSNPYNQLLPKPEIDLGQGWSNSECFHHYKRTNKLMLVKDRINHQESDFNSSTWASSQRAHYDKELWAPNHRYDVSKHKNRSNADEDRWQFTTSNDNIKLLYFPHNYIKEEKWVQGAYQEHFNDFAIFEVDFEDEKEAKLFTRDFYGKYDREKGTKKDKALNFFAEPLHKKYTNQQLLENDAKVYLAGYPFKGMHHKASTNYSLGRKSPSRLTYWGSINREKEGLMLGTSRFAAKYKWAGKTTEGVSYSYVFDHPQVTDGASGSLVTTEDGDVLGVFAWNDTHRLTSKAAGAVALRNLEVRDENGKVTYPAYDFIEGMEGQNGSYKEQIQKYFLKNGQQTNFSRLRGWTA